MGRHYNLADKLGTIDSAKRTHQHRRADKLCKQLIPPAHTRADACRRHDEKNPHQTRNLSHPALDKRNRHRQKHRDRHRKPEPEMNHAGAEHFHADRHQVQQRRP